VHHRESILNAFTGHKQTNLTVQSAQLGCLENRLNVERMTHRFLRIETLTATITLPMLSQHSRSQALVKEGCDRRGEPTLNLAILIEMKPERKPLGRNPLSDALYRNPGMMLNGQGPGRHPLGDTLVSRSRHGVK